MIEKNKFTIISAEIERNMENIKNLQHELNSSLIKSDLEKIEPLMLRGLGSILQDFYSACERIFKVIAQNIDDDLPVGDAWHHQLLERMTYNLPEVRIPVISQDLSLSLHDYLRFRHIFRYVYGFNLKMAKMKPLIMGLDEIATRFVESIRAFVSWFKMLSDQN